MWNVKSFGAIGDGVSFDTPSIQRAIDDCYSSGGGTVVFPSGTYLSSTIVLKSHVHLQIESGCVIKAVADKEFYPENEKVSGKRGYVLFADGAEDIVINGFGAVLGTGQEDWGVWWGITHTLDFRVGLLLFEGCKNITITGVQFLYSDSWTLHFKLCENVLIDRVKILNNFRHLNSDGIDPNSCKNFIISNCHIIAGDDCIVAKTTENHPTENLVVTNCILESPSTAIKLGTESFAAFRDVHFSNCVIKNTSVGLGIFIKDGAVAERVSFSNISIECADREHIKPVIPLYIDIEKRTEDSVVGKVRDVSFNNIQITSGSGCLFQGMPESPIENLTVSNITFRTDKAVDFSTRKKAIGGNRKAPDDGRDTAFIRKPAYFTFAHVRGLIAENITLALDGDAAAQYGDRKAVYGYDVRGAKLDYIRANGAPSVLLDESFD